MYNENCRNLEIILSILLFTSEGTGSAIREATQHEEKIPLLLASTLTVSMLEHVVTKKRIIKQAQKKNPQTSKC